MKKITILLLLISSSGFAYEKVYVKPYVNKNGEYVEGHYRTSPNNNAYDNWSTKGNYNPYTGKSGDQNPYDNYNIKKSYKKYNWDDNDD